MSKYVWVYVVISVSSIEAFAGEREDWYSLTTPAGHKLGYAQSQSETTDAGTKITYRQTLKPAQRAASSRRVVREFTRFEDPNGQTSRLELKSLRSKRRNHIKARVDGDTVNIRRKTDAGDTHYSLPLVDDIYFDDGDALFKSWDFSALPMLEYKNFNLAAEAVQRVTISPAPDFGPHIFIKKIYDGQALRAAAIIERNEQGQISRQTQPFLSSAYIKTKTTKRGARAAGKTPKTRDIIGIKSPYNISEDALGGTIRYRFAYKYGVKFDIPNTGQQRAKSNRDAVFIEICKSCGVIETLSPDDRTKYLKPTPWLQSEYPRLHKAAQKIKTAQNSDHAVMTELGKWTRRKLKDVDFAGHYSAKDALKLGRGDCTEDAVVLAALGRAADIPVRVVSGLVYSRERYHGVRDVFVSHTWVQAWVDGHWKNYDIAMEGFDSSHIVLAIGGGDPALIAAGNSLSGFLDLEVIAQFKKPAPKSPVP